MITAKSFLYEKSESGVATITLNRPERLNALTFEVYRELTGTFAALRTEADVRVVVITGAGRAFCSGGDVHDIIGELFNRDMEGLLEFTRMTCELVRNIRALRKPVIASLNGTTAGAGACIALAADLLPRVVGLAKATELLYTGDFISAQEAERIGLYNRVVPADQLAQVTCEFAERLAQGPAFALAKTKELLDREENMNLDAALECEAQAQAICMQHPDHREAYEAF